MICDVIATGSTGNAVFLSAEGNPPQKGVLIDCGVAYKKIEPYLKRIGLVLLTHIHGDHFNPAAIKKMHTLRPMLRFGCCGWMVPHLLKAGVASSRIDVYDIGKRVRYEAQMLDVEPFALAHDVDNCGYKLTFCDEKVLYATDCATMDGIEAKDYDLYMIEANYTEDEMAERIKRKLETGEFVYEYRAAAGHMSREKADAWLAQNATVGKSKVLYMHQHKEANDEQGDFDGSHDTRSRTEANTERPCGYEFYACD